MTDIKYTIEPSDIEWEMSWQQTRPDGSRIHPEKPEKEMIFEPEDALALLLLNEVIFLNNHWWEKDWPEKAKQITSLNVNCNDVFAWGCADSESLTLKDIESLYRMFIKDPIWGSAIWCMTKRKEMPQRPAEKDIREAGTWDLDALKVEHGLRANCYNGLSRVLAKRKYEAYCAWEKNRDKEPRPWDAKWWDGWNEYVSANPNWNSEEWKAADSEACENWKKENGY